MSRQTSKSGLELSRSCWSDFKSVLSQAKEGKDKDKENQLEFKTETFFHRIIFSFGWFINKNARTEFLVGLLIITFCAIAPNCAQTTISVEKPELENSREIQDKIKYMNLEVARSSARYSTQLLIQTGKDTLTAESLLFHLKAALAATKMRVSMYNLTWGLSDLCCRHTLPIENETNSILSGIVDRLIPCFIITPLDCFWEGSKLLGPHPPIYLNPTKSDITWKNLNPLQFLQVFSNVPSPSWQTAIQSYKKILVEAGITSGYTERWCLDPYDPQCPKTAVNYQTKQTPDITSLFKSGCSGYATELMQWPLDLIVGGIQRNSSGSVTGAKSLQTMFTLMRAEQVYEFHKGIKVGVGWSVERAQELLSEWKRRFANITHHMANSRNHLETNQMLYNIEENLSKFLVNFTKIPC